MAHPCAAVKNWSLNGPTARSCAPLTGARLSGPALLTSAALLALAGDRYFQGGRPLPYLQDALEYPPLLGLVLWLPALVSQSPLGYFTVGYLLLGACGLAAVAL